MCFDLKCFHGSEPERNHLPYKEQFFSLSQFALQVLITIGIVALLSHLYVPEIVYLCISIWGETESLNLPICYVFLGFLAHILLGWLCLPFCRLEAVQQFRCFSSLSYLCKTFYFAAYSNARDIVQCFHLTQYHHLNSLFQNSLFQNNSKEFSTLPS